MYLRLMFEEIDSLWQGGLVCPSSSNVINVTSNLIWNKKLTNLQKKKNTEQKLNPQQTTVGNNHLRN